MVNKSLSHIQQVSDKFRLLFNVLIFSIPVLILTYWLFFNDLPIGFKSELPVAASLPLPLSTLCLGILVSFIPACVVIFGIATLKELFTLYENAIFFSTKNVKCFRRLGYILISWTFANMMFTTLISLVISFNNPAGQRMISFGFDVADIANLIIGAVVVVVSWVMNEASKLEDEQAYTV
jgi:Protein of unknown function (DUF2975)